MLARRRSTFPLFCSLCVAPLLGCAGGEGGDTASAGGTATSTSTSGETMETSGGATIGSSGGATEGSTGATEGSTGSTASTTVDVTSDTTVGATVDVTSDTTVGSSDATTGTTADVTVSATEGTTEGTTTTTAGTTADPTTDATTDATTGATTEDPCPEGTEGCPCLPGDACEGDLVCVDGGCAVVGQSCGDGLLDPGEACDDGNDVDHDGCTSACAPTQVLDLDVGYYGACVLLSGGAVRCWGGGVYAQLGYPSNKQAIGDDDLPGDFGPIALGGSILAIEGGANHNCALREGGDVLCWGRATTGQLGHGNTSQIGDDEHPGDAGPVPLGGVATALSSYHHHNCALLEGGGVRCWGFNSSGSLGVKFNQNVGDNELPTAFPPASLGGKAIAITTGYNHSCAILEGQKMRCWGSNSTGQVGLVGVSSVGVLDHPSDHPPLAYDGVEAIDAGHYITCAITTGGVLHCWGDNDYGQTGHGDTYEIGKLAPPESLPPVDLGGKVLQVSCGFNHTCALLEGGVVRCWGRNQHGQLGLAHTNNIGDNELPKDSPPVKLGAPALKVVVNGDHTCALLEGGVVRCWGDNESGQLGHGNTVTIGDDEHPADVGVVAVF